MTKNPLSLTDFVQQNADATAMDSHLSAANQLIEQFHRGFPPHHDVFPKSEHTSARYTEKRENALLTGVYFALVQGALIRLEVVDENGDFINKLFGYDINTQGDEHKIYLFAHASMYKITSAGSCSYRASYAALCLYEIFANTPIKVVLHSYLPTRDQFVVMLGNKEMGWFVYDPLTNPELVFDSEQYKKSVLTTFRRPKTSAKPFQLTITKELSANFNARWPLIEVELIKMLTENTGTVEELLRDPALLAYLTLSDIGYEDWGKNIRAALVLMAKTIASNFNALRALAIQNDKYLFGRDNNGDPYLIPSRPAPTQAQIEAIQTEIAALSAKNKVPERDLHRHTTFSCSNEVDANEAIKFLYSTRCQKLPDDRVRVAVLVGESNCPSMLPEVLKHADVVIFCDINEVLIQNNEFNVALLRRCNNGLEYMESYFDPETNPLLVNKVQSGIVGVYDRTQDNKTSQLDSKPLDAETLKTILISYWANTFKTTSEEEDPHDCNFLEKQERFEYCCEAAKRLTFCSLKINLFDQEQVAGFKAVLEKCNATITVFNATSLYYYDAPTNFSPMKTADRTPWKTTGNLIRSLRQLTNDETIILFSQYLKVNVQKLYAQYTCGWTDFMSHMIQNVKAMNEQLVSAHVLAASRAQLLKAMEQPTEPEVSTKDEAAFDNSSKSEL